MRKIPRWWGTALDGAAVLAGERSELSVGSTTGANEATSTDWIGLLIAGLVTAGMVAGMVIAGLVGVALQQ